MVQWLRDSGLKEGIDWLLLPMFVKILQNKEEKLDQVTSKYDQEERFQQSGFCNIGRPSALKSQTGRGKIEKDSLKLRLPVRD